MYCSRGNTVLSHQETVTRLKHLPTITSSSNHYYVIIQSLCHHPIIIMSSSNHYVIIQSLLCHHPIIMSSSNHHVIIQSLCHHPIIMSCAASVTNKFLPFMMGINKLPGTSMSEYYYFITVLKHYDSVMAPPGIAVYIL